MSNLPLSKNAPFTNQLFWPGLALKILAAALTLATALTVKIPGEVRGCAYYFIKELYKIHALFSTRHLFSISSPHFIVKYDSQSRFNAGLVLETADRAFNQLAKKYNFSAQNIPIIIYPSRTELNACFGWPASESAMGAYWAGVIRVLDPKAWIPEEEDVREVFVSSGPMVHELTHLIIDHLTRGNVPRWFTEGLAQHEECRITGFQFEAPGNYKEYYPFQKMDRGFDRLPNQALAYRQSFVAVEYIIYVHGEEKIKQILKTLAAGKDMDEALQNAIGMNLKEFANNCQNWVMQSEEEFWAA